MTNFNLNMMRRALVLARRGYGKTSPNPAVGCVIVRDGNIIGEGWHKKAGAPHAEVNALAAARGMARGADLYVTLEPCSHFGKTPPCADALIAAGISKVFIGMTDPNPLVSGKGIKRLLAAGIQVECGVLESECSRLNEAFLRHVTTGFPFVVHKGAMTLDGRTATSSGDSRWITSADARKLVHRLRSKMDAVMIGSGTLLTDDPELTVRLAKGRTPLRIVVDSQLQTPVDCCLLQDAKRLPVIIATVSADPEKHSVLAAKGAEILVCPENSGKVDLVHLLATLGNRGVQSILLEGGETLAGEMLRLGLIDKFLYFLAPKLLGGTGKGLFAGESVSRMSDAIPVRIERIRRVGCDILVEAYPEGACSLD